tara:strand:+ start:1373 stop:2398 length:1026 start_codon:yes stop_codon:yes gene_type:complete
MTEDKMEQSSKELVYGCFVDLYEKDLNMKMNICVEITDAIADLDPIPAPLTIKMYEKRLTSLYNSPFVPFKKDIRSLFGYFQENAPSAKKDEFEPNINTMRTICNNFLKFASISPLFHEDLGEDILKSLHVLAEATKAQSNINRSKEKDNDVSWDFLLGLEKDFPQKKIPNEDLLIYKLYVSPGIDLMPRNDFSNMRIVDTIDDTEDKSCNYFVKDIKKMIFNEFKNSKFHNSFIRDVPDDIISYINQSQKYMFEYRGERVNENSLCKRINRVFTKLSDGKNISINTLRRAYANKVDKSDNIAEIVKDAQNSMHSIETHLTYQTNKKDKKKKEKKCLVIME